MRTRSAHLGCLLLALTVSAGCQSAPRNMPAVYAYYDYRFADARAALRPDAETRNDEQVLLNNVRLGLAALADGDTTEAERALGHSFDLLSTAGLNRDRTVAAVMTHEGVRIWKGEPFEQALMYYWVASLYATMGDWENVRAAAANSLFRLTDFTLEQRAKAAAQRGARGALPEYTAVETDFALGFLMQAIGADLSGTAGAPEQFDAALRIDPSLESIVERLRSRDYDTLLIVDYGKGPTKISRGRDRKIAVFEPQDRRIAPLIVMGETPDTHNAMCLARVGPVADVNRMAVDHRWNDFERVRRMKSALGDGLTLGGAIVVSEGFRHDSAEAMLVGAGMIVAGLLTKSGAKADTRYLEFAPQLVYLVPLRLEDTTTLQLSIENSDRPMLVLPDIEPGHTPDVGSPRAVYVRLHGRDSRQYGWMTARMPHFGNDHTGVRPGDYPWILGGRDVSTPSEEVLRAYQEYGYLTDFTLDDLIDLYHAEGIVIGSGLQMSDEQRRNPTFRHILEGGQAIFTPHPDSLGFKRLMFHPWPEYEPLSEKVRTVSAQIAEQKAERYAAGEVE